MSAGPKLELFRVYNDPRSLSAVANTITLSFAHDPLIRWLRPLVAPWARHDFETYRWQYRRVQRATVEGLVLQSTSVTQMGQMFPSKHPQSKHAEAVATEPDRDGKVDGDAGAVVMLFPPPSHLKWTPGRIFLACQLRLLDIFSPVSEKGTSEQRMERMMAAHNDAIDRVKKQYQLKNLWYLEVIAVHPSLQARGLGKKVMGCVLDYAKHEPIVLECTSESNISFYMSLGFEVVDEVELVDDDEAVRLWVMLRQTVNKDPAE
ncbi:GNAT family N-acetyltransferase [Aspergillus thermomutatus]|uniref:N-acetyltransferase domain-containing protein n=1 Tax=Aspergillus thermomutatus TaxID=41047 RepID=A0A397HYZ3_ASPTH|nr:uncharacterized protein CDV56_103343 [Aspergillus thermomutatus]RHZ65810.1 hypothetical protein CDV56_103343 [Aspergillus thermomutatus]